MACQPYHSYVWKPSIHLNVANSNPAHLLHATCSQQGFNIIGHRILVAANHLSSKWGASTQTAMGSESQSWVWVCCGCSLVAHYSLQYFKLIHCLVQVSLCRHTLLVLLFGLCAYSNTRQVPNLLTEAEVIYGKLSVLSLELHFLFRLIIILVRSENST